MLPKRGETFSSVVPSLFAMLKCNFNRLLCDKIMSAAYLASMRQELKREQLLKYQENHTQN